MTDAKPVYGPALPEERMNCHPWYAWPGDHTPHAFPGYSIPDAAERWYWCRGRGGLSVVGILMGVEQGDLATVGNEVVRHER